MSTTLFITLNIAVSIACACYCWLRVGRQDAINRIHRTNLHLQEELAELKSWNTQAAILLRFYIAENSDADTADRHLIIKKTEEWLQQNESRNSRPSA